MFKIRPAAVCAVLLSLSMLAACACSNTRPDATDAVRQGSPGGTGASSSQAMGHLGLGGLAIAEDGDAVGGATTRLGLDVQGAANAAANPVTIHPVVGNASAASALLSEQSPEERVLANRAERIALALRRAQEDLDLAAPADKPALGQRIAELEDKESAVAARLGELYKAKLDAAKALVPDLSALASIHYNVMAPQITTSGKALTDPQSDAASQAFQAWMRQQQASTTTATTTGGGQ